MSTHSFTGFIPLNVAPSGAAAIGVYDPIGSRIGTMALPESSLGRPRGAKLYSFGILSDVHQNSSSTNSEYLEDLDNALTYFGSEGVEWSPSTPAAAALSKIGFYGGGFGGAAGTTYSTGSGFYGDTSKGALQLQVSSSFVTNGGSFPVTVTLRNLRYKVN